MAMPFASREMKFGRVVSQLLIFEGSQQNQDIFSLASGQNNPNMASLPKAIILLVDERPLAEG